MSEFSASKWGKKGGFPSLLSQLPSPCLGTNLPCECSLPGAGRRKKPIPARFPSNLWILQKIQTVGTFPWPAFGLHQLVFLRLLGAQGWMLMGFAGFGLIQGCFPRGKKCQAGCG